MVDRTRVRGALHCGDEEEQNIKSHERNRKEEYQHCRHCCSRIGLLCLAYSILMVILLIAFPPLRLTPLASTVKLRQNSKLHDDVRRHKNLRFNTRNDIANLLAPILCTQKQGATTRTCGPVKKAIFIVGVESSGTKLAASIIAKALNILPGNSKDGKSQVWYGGHGAAFDEGILVLHRSLPHGVEYPYFPNLWAISSFLKSSTHFGRCNDVRLVVVTRDQNIALRSKLMHHQHFSREAVMEQAYGTAILQSLLAPPFIGPVFVWSHESFLMLREGYARQLVEFVTIPVSHNTSMKQPPVVGNVWTPQIEESNLYYTNGWSKETAEWLYRTSLLIWKPFLNWWFPQQFRLRGKAVFDDAD